MSWSAEQIGYCSNVHAGETASEVLENISRYTSDLRKQRGLTAMQHGLWLSEKAAQEFSRQPDLLNSCRQTLESSGLTIATLNGFPVGDFHAGQVKESVYLPHWAEPKRLSYTLTIADLLAQLLSTNQHYGSISTLPLGYSKNWNAENQAASLTLLSNAIQELSRLEDRTGKQIQLCLEMEPGCALEETPQIIALFEQQLPPVLKSSGISIEQMHRYLGVCFDICHQAVMQEDVEQSLQQIYNANIQIGKIQISSALKVRQPGDPEVNAWLSDYAESRYLHQVTGMNDQHQRLFADDLQAVLHDPTFQQLDEWRIHFHVPVHQLNLGVDWASTTANEIDRVFAFLASHPDCRPQLELETYTWDVLPESRRPANEAELVDGLAAELLFIESGLQQHGLLGEPTDA